MQRRSPRHALLAALACAALLTASAIARPSATPTVTLYAAGDIATCHGQSDEQTAKLLKSTNGPIAALGDLVYPDGTEEDFRNCFDPSWGPLTPRIRAALGNHEYNSGSAQAAIDRFHLPANGWYAYEAGSWHVVVLNSNCDDVACGRGSPQWRWLRSDLAKHPSLCTLAYWHAPRFSSGLHGSSATMAPLWNLLARAHADVVLSGHDHDYERFAPIDGIREFVVGTGGAEHYPIIFTRDSSVVHNTAAFGVLRLRLGLGSYAWRFLPAGGSAFTDAGSGRCRR